VKTENQVWNLEWCTQKYRTRNKKIISTRNNKGGVTSEKPVVAIDKNGCTITFKSATEASNKLNIRHSTIVGCLKKYKSRKTAGGYKWEYE